MTLFGPHYPAALQNVVNHAERFCALMGRIEATQTPPDDLGRAWLLGRTEEIEMVLGGVVEDWKAGRLSAEAAESAANAYMHALHLGAQARLHLSPPFECCDGADAATPLPLNEEALTRLLPLGSSRRDAGETFFDPRAILDFVSEVAPQPPHPAGQLPPGQPLGQSVRLGERKT